MLATWYEASPWSYTRNISWNLLCKVLICVQCKHCQPMYVGFLLQAINRAGLGGSQRCPPPSKRSHSMLRLLWPYVGIATSIIIRCHVKRNDFSVAIAFTLLTDAFTECVNYTTVVPHFDTLSPVYLLDDIELGNAVIQSPRTAHYTATFDALFTITIQFSSLLFTCRINMYKANYRHSKA
jgi:hypothetical protein